MLSRVRGFTLVEVLVALMIMALMAAMAWQGVDGVVRSRDASQARLEQTLRLNTVVAQWEQDLTSVQESNAAPGLQFDGASLRLTRRAAGGMQVAVWSLRPRTGTGGVLQRWTSPIVTGATELREHWLRSLQFQGNEPGQLDTLSGISTWQVVFYRGNAWTNAQSSDDTVPVAPTGASGVAQRRALPTGVRLVLSFGEGSGLNGSLTRDTALGPQQP
jgi:general secretion pathway protein J